MAAPLPFLLTWITGLLSLAMLGTGGWLIVQWREGGLADDAFLMAGVALLALSLFGRIPVRRLLGSGQPLAELPAGEVEVLTGSGGAALHVEMYGPKDADPVILTHGWGLDRSIWAGAVNALSGSRRVILWDLPGLGRSGRPLDGDYALERLAADLDTVLHLAAGKPAVLAGHSVGGMTILTWAQAQGSALSRRAAGLVLMNTTPLMPVRTSKGATLLMRLQKPVLEPLLRFTAWAEPFVRLMNWASYLNGSLHLVARVTSFGDAPGWAAVDRVALLTARNAPGVQAKGMLAMLKWDAEREPQQLNLPVRILAGQRDLLTCPVASRYMADVAPDASLTTVQGVGHMGLLEEPAAYEEALARFTEQVTDRLALMSRPRSYDISPSTSMAPSRSWATPRSDDAPQPSGAAI